MKKSDLKQLRANIQKAAAPQSKKEDLSDELTNLFDDGTKLGDEKSTPVTPVTPVTRDAAPKRDFTRVANSVVRDAIPAGVFTGKGKQLYDYLYLQTRGAIVPVHSARLPTERVMRGAGMTRHTYRAHLQRLVSTGLIHVEEKPGEHGGNVFTVYLPDEIGLKRGDRGHRGDTGDTADSGENLPVVQGSEVDPGDRGLNVEAQDTSAELKTSFKTTTIDDEKTIALSDLSLIFNEASLKLTGHSLRAGDRERWAELARVLVAELNEAAARADHVSSVPAFLTTHLKRRFAQKSSPAKGEGKSTKDQSKKLSNKDLEETAASFADLIKQGAYTLESLDEQYADGWSPNNWTKIRSMIMAQLEEKGSNA